jgi:hypothetical protein
MARRGRRSPGGEIQGEETMARKQTGSREALSVGARHGGVRCGSRTNRMGGRMIRTALALFAFLSLPAAALAQNFSGTYSVPNQQGGMVTLTLRQDAQQRVTGTLTGNGNTLQIRGQVQNGSVLGTATGGLGALYLAAQFEGQRLRVMLAEAGPDGQPNLGAAQQIVMPRAAPAAEAGAPAQGAGPQSQHPAQQAPQGGSPADAQLTQLLTSSAWCAFSYNQRSGASSKERVVFGRDGRVLQQTGAETYSSGYGGTFAGQSSRGNQGRWRVQGGGLLLSQDGYNWEPQQLQVTRNSNGYPIIKSGTKEYMQCS